MSAAEVIRTELSTAAGFHTGMEWANRVLDALKRHGYAVVELPKPDHGTEATYDEHGWRGWTTEYGTVQVSDSGTVAIDRMYRFSDLPEEPSHLRAVAAVLLAAADVTESLEVSK